MGRLCYIFTNGPNKNKNGIKQGFSTLFVPRNIKPTRALKQQEAIAAVQLNLNKMSQVKEDLKSSNEFKPYLSFSKDLFGQLNLNEFSIDLFKSQILTCQQPLELIKLCEFDLKDKF